MAETKRAAYDTMLKPVHFSLAAVVGGARS